MIDTLSNIIAGVFLLIGAAIALISALGLIRLPDVFARMHAASKAGAAGSTFILLAVGAHAGEASIWLKCIATIAFFFLTAPVSAHLLAKSALLAGFKADFLDDIRASQNRKDVKPD